MKQRALRISTVIKNVVSNLIQNEIRDPRIGFVSVSDVEVSGDLRLAKIYISPMGTDEEKQASMAGLESAKGMIRTAIGQAVKLKYTPEIQLIQDDSIARGSELLDLINKVTAPKEQEEEKE
ncbi:MAG: 30S ribosome-binding factor RbfA [Firmicutes bacterium]|jgi:ribosome-binding factor A|nr:30S ribosome-binding factor RbfA [Bacillota bacterium]